MKPGHQQWLKRLPVLFEIPAPDTQRLLRRIEIMERDIMLPVKAVFIGMILYSFHSTSFHSTEWTGLALSMSDLMVETVQFVFWFYILANIIFAAALFRAEQLPLAVVQWTVVTSSLVDGLFIAGLASLSGGLDSILFWLFVTLIVRNAVSVPPGFSQLFLNVAISLCYVLVGALDIFVMNNETTLSAFDVDDWGEPFALRLLVLLLVAGGCYGTQLLLERQQIAAEEAGEFAARESQLRSAGRLAAEFAHPIKNPLAIINNTAFSLQRSLRDGKTDAARQIGIIQEEVARADRVITQITGYAQLSEGRVEKLDVTAELDRAIAQVFPSAVPTQIKIHREYAAHFPPVLMQRGHLSEILVNLLQNAREALGQKGSVFVTADCRRDYSIEISVRDDGPGIPPDKTGRIFEAYYTTKEKGTGLGLAIVKHNVELYGGTVRVESKSGHGAKFLLLFPAKALMKLSKP
jgi:signal transduction histidine kinase